MEEYRLLLILSSIMMPTYSIVTKDSNNKVTYLVLWNSITGNFCNNRPEIKLFLLHFQKQYWKIQMINGSQFLSVMGENIKWFLNTLTLTENELKCMGASKSSLHCIVTLPYFRDLLVMSYICNYQAFPCNFYLFLSLTKNWGWGVVMLWWKTQTDLAISSCPMLFLTPLPPFYFIWKSDPDPASAFSSDSSRKQRSE